MIRRPDTLDSAIREGRRGDAEFRAGGTDLEARRRSGLVASTVVDLASVPGLDGYELGDDGCRLGAMTRIGRIAGDDELVSRYPALGSTAASLANPHTRAAATLGGNIAQQTRCWYYRTGRVECHMTGGDSCPARGGIEEWAVVFETGPCIAPHPSSLAMALLAYDATLEINGDEIVTLAEALGDGSDPTRPNALEPGQIITAVLLGPPAPEEQGAYWRTNAQAHAEWPLVEAVARIVLDDGMISDVSVAVGGVASVPIRLGSVEDALRGERLDRVDLRDVANLAMDAGTVRVPGNGKALLVPGTVLEVLERALSGEAESERTFERSL